MFKPFSSNYPITSDFGPRQTFTKFHDGIDFGCTIGTEIFAVEDGTIIVSTFDQNGATWIDLKSNTGNIWRYLHFSENRTTVGQAVKKGQVIGLSGGAVGAKGAGLSGGPHLHLGMKDNGSFVDWSKTFNLKTFTKDNQEFFDWSNVESNETKNDNIQYFKQQDDMSQAERDEFNQLRQEISQSEYIRTVTLPDKIRLYSSQQKPIVDQQTRDRLLAKLENKENYYSNNQNENADSIINELTYYLGDDNMNYRKALKDTQNQLESAKKELQDFQTQLPQLKQNVSENSQQLQDKDKQIQELQKNLSDLNQEKQTLDSNLKDLQENYQNLQQNHKTETNFLASQIVLGSKESYSLNKAFIGWEKNGLITGLLSMSAVSITAIIIQFVPSLNAYKDMIIQALILVGFGATTSQATKNVINS
jgi:hypothetical protein